MISKIINSYDIHVHSQQLRIVEQGELSVNVEGFNNKNLLLNEPRGNKYVNLLIYKIDKNTIDVELESFSTIDNIELLLKAFISSLLDRYRISKQDNYQVKLEGQLLTLKHAELSKMRLPNVKQQDNIFTVNDKKIIVEETDLDLTIDNISNIKGMAAGLRQEYYDYLVLKGRDAHVVFNQDQVIKAYPVLEIVSILRNIYGEKDITSFNGWTVHVDHEIPIEYYLIANSQFYIDDTDIYHKGFIIK